MALSLLANNSNGSFGVSPPLLLLPRITLILTVLIGELFELPEVASIGIDLAYLTASCPKNLRYFAPSVDENPPLTPDPVPD